VHAPGPFRFRRIKFRLADRQDSPCPSLPGLFRECCWPWRLPARSRPAGRRRGSWVRRPVPGAGRAADGGTR